MSATLILTPSIQTVSPSTTQLVPPPVWQSVNVRAVAESALFRKPTALAAEGTEEVGAVMTAMPINPPSTSPVFAYPNPEPPCRFAR